MVTSSLLIEQGAHCLRNMTVVAPPNGNIPGRLELIAGIFPLLAGHKKKLLEMLEGARQPVSPVSGN